MKILNWSPDINFKELDVVNFLGNLYILTNPNKLDNFTVQGVLPMKYEVYQNGMFSTNNINLIRMIIRKYTNLGYNVVDDTVTNYWKKVCLK